MWSWAFLGQKNNICSMVMSWWASITRVASAADMPATFRNSCKGSVGMGCIAAATVADILRVGLGRYCQYFLLLHFLLGRLFSSSLPRFLLSTSFWYPLSCIFRYLSFSSSPSFFILDPSFLSSLSCFLLDPSFLSSLSSKLLFFVFLVL